MMMTPTTTTTTVRIRGRDLHHVLQGVSEVGRGQGEGGCCVGHEMVTQRESVCKVQWTHGTLKMMT